MECIVKLGGTITIYLSRSQTFGNVKHEEHSQNLEVNKKALQVTYYYHKICIFIPDKEVLELPLTIHPDTQASDWYLVFY